MRIRAGDFPGSSAPKFTDDAEEEEVEDDSQRWSPKVCTRHYAMHFTLVVSPNHLGHPMERIISSILQMKKLRLRVDR